MNLITIRAILILFFVVFCSEARSDNFNYDFVQASFISSDSSAPGVNIEGDGNTLEFSYSLFDELAVNTSINTGTFDNKADGKNISFGALFHTAMSEFSDINVGLFIGKTEVSLPGQSPINSNDGYLLYGVRSRLSEYIELDLSVLFLDVSDHLSHAYEIGTIIGNSNGLQVELLYSYNEISASSKIEKITFGVIYSF